MKATTAEKLESSSNFSSTPIANLLLQSLDYENRRIMKVYTVIICVFVLWYMPVRLLVMLDGITFEYPQKMYVWQQRADRTLLKSDPLWLIAHYLVSFIEILFCTYCIWSGNDNLMKNKYYRIPFYTFIGLLLMNLGNFTTYGTMSATMLVLALITFIIFSRINGHHNLYFMILTSKLLLELFSRIEYGNSAVYL